MQITIYQLEAIKSYLEDFCEIHTTYQEIKKSNTKIDYTAYLEILAKQRN